MQSSFLLWSTQGPWLPVHRGSGSCQLLKEVSILVQHCDTVWMYVTGISVTLIEFVSPCVRSPLLFTDMIPTCHSGLMGNVTPSENLLTSLSKQRPYFMLWIFKFLPALEAATQRKGPYLFYSSSHFQRVTSHLHVTGTYLIYWMYLCWMFLRVTGIDTSGSSYIGLLLKIFQKSK